MKAYIRIVGLLVAQLEATATNDTRVTYQPAGGCDTSAITTNVMMDFKKCEADEDEYAMRELYRRDSLRTRGGLDRRRNVTGRILYSFSE